MTINFCLNFFFNASDEGGDVNLSQENRLRSSEFYVLLKNIVIVGVGG